MVVLKEYPSSSSNATHEVRMGDDGKVYCTCKGWRFHNRRWCKHLEDYTSNMPTYNKDEFKKAVVSASPIEAVTQQVIDELKGAGYGN